MDYAEPFEGKMLLLLVDTHSKWIDIHVVQSATSTVTIQKLRQSYSAHGIPDLMVTDNGTNFKSSETEEFLKSNGVQHICSAPQHPASNGLAERAVQTLKSSLRKQGVGSLQDRIARFLLSYRVTPHATTGVPPCELLMGRKLRTLLDKVRPDVADRVKRQQGMQKKRHDLHSRARDFSDGETVLAKDFSNGGGWRQASVVDRKGAVAYDCRFHGDGRLVHRHVDQLRRLRFEAEGHENRERQGSCRPLPEQDVEPTGMPQEESETERAQAERAAVEPDGEDRSPEAIPQLRRSLRKRTVPDRLGI